MNCELCQQAEATIHLTQVVDGAVKKVHLCEACAAKSGFDIQGPMSVTDILLGLGGQGEPKAATTSKRPERSCPSCHLRRADFKKTGRLGCPDCYDAFKDELGPLLRAMHRGDRHRGKVPERERSRLQATEEVEALQEKLDAAIQEERYEDAARLRDEIQAVRSTSPESPES